MASTSSRALQGVYRLTDKDGVVYGVELVPQGRRRMSGRISAKDLDIFVNIGTRDDPNCLRIQIQNYVMKGVWEDSTQHLLTVTSGDKHCPWTGQWERVKKDKESEWSVEIMWTKTHKWNAHPRQRRKAKNEFSTMLRDLAPDNAFDPRTMWDPEGEERKKRKEEEEAKAAKKKSGGGKKKKKMSKAEEIRAKNTARMEQGAREKDLAKLNAAIEQGTNAVARLAVSTPEIQIIQIGTLLKLSLDNKSAVDILDCLWEVEEVFKTLDSDGQKKFLSGYRKPFEKAQTLRANMEKLAKTCKLRKEPKSIVQYQLQHMYDRLPPLTLVNKGKWELDPWQKRVLSNIDNGQSTVVSAPTSSGKTVLSTYLCTKKATKGVLFVVPTEPLAIQVASMFSVLKDTQTHMHVFNGVGLVIPSQVFPPDKFTDQIDIVVGTPTSIETILTSKRVKGFDFDFAVFDEVHNLNGIEGGALQRVILQIDCPILALSATIRNAEELAKWMQMNEDSLPKVEGKKPRKVLLEVVKSRFINLQRHVWTGTTLEELHPCAALTREQIITEGFEAGDLAFTARDVLNLYKKMKKRYPKECVKDIKPEKCFSRDPKVRVTMADVKEYEMKLKTRLVELAADDKYPKETEKLLEGFREKAKILEEQQKKEEEEEAKKNDAKEGNGVEEKKSGADIYPVALDLKEKSMIPAVLFQFDESECRRQFTRLVESFEQTEKTEYPHLAKERAAAYKAYEEQMAQWERAVTEATKNNEPPPSEPSPPSLTGDDPVPKHTMFPPGRQLNSTEVKFVKDSFKKIAGKTGNKININNDHILMRGLRRGVGIYNTELPPAYLTVVQKFAQKGRLGIVFSDEALAYGVNMPFRTSAFIGDPGPELLDPLLAQQAQGRAGRRGMDRQGHLAYIGISWGRIQELMRGILPEIVGRDTAYPALALAQEIRSNSEKGVSDGQLTRVITNTLTEYRETKKNSGDEIYVNQSKRWITELGLSMLKKENDCPAWRREMIWYMRDFPSESFAMEKLLDEMEEVFAINESDPVKYENRFFYICSRIMDRTTYAEGLKYQQGHEPRKSLSKCIPEDWEMWTGKLDKSQGILKEKALRVEGMDDNTYEKHVAPMILKHDIDVDLDSTTFLIFQTFGSLLNQIDSLERHWARERFFRVGECMRVMYNSIRRSGTHPNISYLTRRTFLRMRYILFETFSNLFVVNKQNVDSMEDISRLMGELGMDNLDDDGYFDEDDIEDGNNDDDNDNNNNDEVKKEGNDKKVSFAEDVPKAPTSNGTVEPSVPGNNNNEEVVANGGESNPFDNLKKKKKKKKKKKAYVPDLS